VIYADYRYYRDEFRGKLIPETDFDRAAMSATQYINNVTFGRIGSNVTEAVKNACCAVAEVYYSGSVSPRAASGITSEKVGNHSVSYSAAENISTQAKRLRSAVKLWLGSTGLLYRGLKDDN